MASNSTDPHRTDDDEYQVRYDDDEEDDERTIEEEEQLASDEEENELDDLEAGANMPLEELMKLYGQNASAVHHNQRQNNDDDEESNHSSPHNRQHRLHHLLGNNGQLLPENDDDDDTDDSFEPEIVKVINVGDEYQAEVDSQPEFNSDDTYLDDRQVPDDELLWSPSSPVDDNDNEKIDEYLKTIHKEFPYADDEISLQTLLNCQMNTESALIKFRQLPVKAIYSYPEWTNEEIQSFEEGLREYGKNFFKIMKFKCPNRNVREIIHYYYQWKKSERSQLFIEEQQRLNAITSVTDMIEKLIEEQEQQLCTAVGVINSTNSSSSAFSNDLKLNSSISFITTTSTTTTTTTKRSFDQVEHDSESSAAKKPSINTNNSSTATIV